MMPVAWLTTANSSQVPREV